MAEGWARKLLSDEWEVRSAGIEAFGLDSYAVKAMSEVGIDISKQTSDPIDHKIMNKADVVITLCRDLADECPMTPPFIKREYWGFSSPSRAEGTEEEKWTAYQRVRDEIGEKMKHFSQKQERALKADSPCFSSETERF